MIAGSRRGLEWSAMQKMQLGAIVDYCIEYDNQQNRADNDEPTKRKATQADINAFFGR
jgi:hypothetical protein